MTWSMLRPVLEARSAQKPQRAPELAYQPVRHELCLTRVMRSHRIVSVFFTVFLGLVSSSLGLSACSADDGSSEAAANAESEAGSPSGPSATSGEGPGATGSTLTGPDAHDGGATGSVDGGDGAVGLPTEKEACVAYVKAICARKKQCNVNEPFSSCEAAAAQCPDLLFAHGSSRTLGQVVACTQTRAAQSCAEVRAGFEPPCAITLGTQKAGEPCHFDTQCASLRCAFGNIGACSTCSALQTEVPGESCSSITTCGPNARCLADGGCAPIVVPTTLAVGASCVGDAGSNAQACPHESPCASTTADASTGVCSTLPSSGSCLFALGAKNQSLCAPGTFCVRSDPSLPQGECLPPGTKDELCGNRYGGRTCADGFFCAGGLGGTCQPKHVVNEPCEGSSECEPSLFCERTVAGGKCVPRLEIGESCEPGDGGVFYRECKPGAGCSRLALDGGPMRYFCTRRAGLGEACGPFEPCAGMLTCEAGTCALVDCPKDAGAGG